MRSGLFLPPFDALSDPGVVALLAIEAEEAGWHGVFLWDHVRWREPVLEVADAWVTLGAIATATRAIRLGPMVTPLARRRPVKVARETASLDRLSGGRLTLGVGLGDEQAGNEYSITGEELDERRRARILDQSLEILTAAWTGEPVHHRGEHYVVDGMRSCRGRFNGRALDRYFHAFEEGRLHEEVCTRRAEELSAELTSLEVRRSELAQRCADLRNAG